MPELITEATTYGATPLQLNRVRNPSRKGRSFSDLDSQRQRQRISPTISQPTSGKLSPPPASSAPLSSTDGIILSHACNARRIFEPTPLTRLHGPLPHLHLRSNIHTHRFQPRRRPTLHSPPFSTRTDEPKSQLLEQTSLSGREVANPPCTPPTFSVVVYQGVYRT